MDLKRTFAEQFWAIKRGDPISAAKNCLPWCKIGSVELILIAYQIFGIFDKLKVYTCSISFKKLNFQDLANKQ